MAENENVGTEITFAGNWAKPANTLIEKISNATGALLSPWQTVRMAKAEVKAQEIMKVGEIELNALEQRTIQRLIAEESKKQQNIETITHLALEQLDETAKPEEIDNDWLSNYFDKTKNISDDIMQQHWAKILSSEANEPGSFAKRTIEIMYQLEKDDAELFASLCNFTVENDDELIIIMVDRKHAILELFELNFGNLIHLDDIGLIKFKSLDGFSLKHDSSDMPRIYKYCDKEIKVSFKKGENIKIGSVYFTQAGRELGNIVEKEFDENIFNYIVEQFTKQSDLNVILKDR